MVISAQPETQLEELASTHAILAEEGIAPGPGGHFDEEALLAAIRARGWTSRLAGQPDDWFYEVRAQLGPTKIRYGIASAPERSAALALALAALITVLAVGVDRVPQSVNA